MARKKLKKFAENKENARLIEPGKPFYTACRGNWHASFFGNTGPIFLELACGRGEYTTGLAAHFPDKNFIGVDVKGDRLWYGCKVAEAENYANAAFLRAQVHNLTDFFAPGEVAEIWIPFPDPHPKNRNRKRRLTHPRFLGIYRKILQPGGSLHLKTDNSPLFDYTLGVLDGLAINPQIVTKNLYHSPYFDHHHGIVTRYEKIFFQKGFDINYLKFSFETPQVEQNFGQKEAGN